MKLNDPRSTLIAGLTLALSLNVSSSAFGAGATTDKVLRVAKAQSDLQPTPIPYAPIPGLPALPPSPIAPTQTGPTPLQSSPNLNPTPLSPNAPSVMSVPTTLGSQPSLAPVDRPPLGMYYGEREMLDGLNGVVPRPLLTPQAPYPAAPPQSRYEVPFESAQGTVGDPGAELGSPPHLAPQYGATDRFGFAPPPGTLGQTYKRRSRRLEEAKHPRVGVVEVRLPENVDVTATGLKSKWTGKLWRLESDPLVPGIPHIYEIKASWGAGADPQVRTVRLIMGRIVDLDF